MQSIARQLKELKRAGIGEAGDVQKARSRAMLLEAIGHDGVAVAQHGARVTSADVIAWQFQQFISMPITIGVSIFVLLVGGSLTTVSASSNSLPGDALYSVKLATERAQLKLASIERKAILHTEFAERRLKEASAIRESGDASREAYIGVALDDFRRQMESATDDIQRLKNENRSDAVALATQVDKKIDQLNTVITQTQNSGEEVTVARETTKTSSDAIVNVIVEAHEEDPAENITQTLYDTYRKRLIEVQARQTFNLGRIAMIREWSVKNKTAISDLSQLEVDIKNVSNDIYSSMNFSAQGGHRMAFDLLNAVESQLLSIEASLASIEDVMVKPLGEAAQNSESTGLNPNDSINNQQEGS